MSFHDYWRQAKIVSRELYCLIIFIRMKSLVNRGDEDAFRNLQADIIGGNFLWNALRGATMNNKPSKRKKRTSLSLEKALHTGK